MPAHPTPTARLPRDLEARERLQRAQQAEAAAVANVYRADAQLAKAHAKYDAAVAAATKIVDQARDGVAQAQAALVDISGRDRAAQLLGITKADIRKTSTRAAAGDG